MYERQSFWDSDIFLEKNADKYEKHYICEDVILLIYR